MTLPTADGVLVISGLGGWREGTLRDEKVHAHIVPIREATDHVTVLSIGTFPSDVRGIDARTIPPSGSRLVDFVRLALAALRLARSDRHDLVASFSLVPYGLIALLAGRLARKPSHLGIIGMDLDVHADGPFGPPVRWCFRRFAAVSIAGSAYRERLEGMGVAPERIHTILHPVPPEYANVGRADPEYDLLWVGRMSPEKGPDRFLDVVARLRSDGEPVTAGMVGDGPAMDRIVDRVERERLDDAVELVGWSDRPVEHYRRARLYVLTSEREMLPLTLVEAMLAGTPPVTPPLGAIPDLVRDGQTGYVVPHRDPAAYARTIREALDDASTRAGIAERAREVEAKVHPDTVAETWAAMFSAMLPESANDRRAPGRPPARQR